MAVATADIPWDDRDVGGLDLATNGDDIPQDNELDLAGRAAGELRRAGARPVRSGYRAGVQRRDRPRDTARTRAERVGQRGLVSPRVPQLLHGRQPAAGFQSLSSGGYRKPAQRRGDPGLGPEGLGVAPRCGRPRDQRDGGPRAGLQRIRAQPERAAARGRDVHREHDDPADRYRALRRSGRSEQPAVLRSREPAVRLQQPAVAERPEAGRQLSPAVRYTGERELHEHARAEQGRPRPHR